MKLSGYSLDIEKASQTIIEKGYKTVALQIPEGLKGSVFSIVDYLEKKTKARVFVIADPCFGACDIIDYELKDLNVEFVVHIGHTSIPSIENFPIPVFFVNALSTKNVTKVVENSISILEGKRIGVVTTAQHLHTLDTAKNILQKHDLEPLIAEGDRRISTKGQILGCNFSAGLNIADKVDSFLFIGSGMFHPVGLLLATKKPVIAADPYTNIVKKQEVKELRDVILRQRHGAIARSKDAKRFGILVGIKKGQQRIKLAYKINELLDSMKKESYIIALNNFSPLYLQSFREIDCFVSTACPRIAIDDYMQYKIPIITPVELEILLGKKKWEDYQFDQIPQNSGPGEI